MTDETQYRIPTPSRVLWLLPPALFAAGLLFVLALQGSLSNALTLGAWMAAPAVFVCIIVNNLSQRRIWRRHDFHWYRQTFPRHAGPNRRLACRHCGGAHITVRDLMDRSFTRAHVCNRCGGTLYFSPENA